MLTPHPGIASCSNEHSGSHIDILGQSAGQSRHALPLMSGEVRAGFPIHADAEMDRVLDLTEHLIPHPSASYFCRAKGDSMEGHGVYDGDLLIVDRSLAPVTGDIIVVALDGELTCKQLGRWHGQPALLSGNPAYPPITLRGVECETWGVVTHNIHAHRGRGRR